MSRTGPQAKTSARSVEQAQRRAEMLTLRVEGLTLEQIGQRMGVGADTVQRVISRALTAMTKEPAQELLALELGRCDVLLNEAMQTVKAFHPMVSGGKVVYGPVFDEQGQPLQDPETGEVMIRPIEDKAPKLASIATAVRVLERRAKLLGLDAPIRATQELTVTSIPELDLSHLSPAELEEIKNRLYPPRQPMLAGKPQESEAQ